MLIAILVAIIIAVLVLMAIKNTLTNIQNSLFEIENKLDKLNKPHYEGRDEFGNPYKIQKK